MTVKSIYTDLGLPKSLLETVAKINEEDTAYQRFFRTELKKRGVTSPEELSKADQKKFYDYIDANWKAKDAKADAEEAENPSKVYVTFTKKLKDGSTVTNQRVSFPNSASAKSWIASAKKKSDLSDIELHDELKAVNEDKLSYQDRKKLPDSAFVFPKERKYPIHDISHARNALSRVAADGTPAEQSKVQSAVYSKYPELKKNHDERTKNESATQGDLDKDKPIVVSGHYGMKSKPFQKKFRNYAAYEKWRDGPGDNYDVSHVYNESVKNESLTESEDPEDKVREYSQKAREAGEKLDAAKKANNTSEYKRYNADYEKYSKLLKQAKSSAGQALRQHLNNESEDDAKDDDNKKKEFGKKASKVNTEPMLERKFVPDDESEDGDKNIIMQLRKVISTHGAKSVEFNDGKKETVTPQVAHAILDKFSSLKPVDKEKMQTQLCKSKAEFDKVVGTLSEAAIVGVDDVPGPAGEPDFGPFDPESEYVIAYNMGKKARNAASTPRECPYGQDGAESVLRRAWLMGYADERLDIDESFLDKKKVLTKEGKDPNAYRLDDVQPFNDYGGIDTGSKEVQKAYLDGMTANQQGKKVKDNPFLNRPVNDGEQRAWLAGYFHEPDMNEDDFQSIFKDYTHKNYPDLVPKPKKKG